MTIFVNNDFEAEISPFRYEANVSAPAGFFGDIGDGETVDPDVAQVWCIDASDNPALGRLPPSFINGNKCIWGSLHPYTISTEAFLMHIHYDTTTVRVTWYQMFKNFPTGGDWLPIFWNFVRKVDSTGVIQYTVPTIQLILSSGGLGVSEASDTNLNLSGATNTIPPLQTLKWYKFEVEYVYATAGRYELKIDDVTRFLFLGNTVATTGAEPTVWYTTLIGFEVGMQRNGDGNYEYWLDAVRAEDIPTTGFTVTLQASPVNVPIRVDGVAIGKTPQYPTLSGSHTIEVDSEVTA